MKLFIHIESVVYMAITVIRTSALIDHKQMNYTCVLNQSKYSYYTLVQVYILCDLQHHNDNDPSTRPLKLIHMYVCISTYMDMRTFHRHKKTDRQIRTNRQIVSSSH